MKFVLAAIAVAGIVSPAVAQPAEGKTMIAPLDGSSDAHPNLADKLTRTLVNAAQKAGVKHAQGAIGLDELALMSGCAVEDPGCRKILLETLNAEAIIAGSISDTSGGVEVTILQISPDGSLSSEPHTVAGSSEAELVAGFEPIAGAIFGLETEPVDPEPAPSPEPEPEPEPEPVAAVSAPPAGTGPVDRAGGIRPWTYGLMGAGAALTVGGLVTLARAGSTQSDIDGAPTDTAADLEALEQLEDTGRFRYRLSYGLLAVGAAGLAAGVTLAIIQRRSGRDSSVAVVKSGDSYAAVFGGSF